MKRTELINHIKGSYLKKQYLEAFLVQSAYIEGLLKIFTDYSYWNEVSEKIALGSPLINELRKRIKKYGLNELIDFLFKSKLIDDDQKNLLHEYRAKRNDVLHDLVRQISGSEFERELEVACELGDKIIDDQKFKDIEKIIDDAEKVILQQKSSPSSSVSSSVSVVGSAN